MKATMICMGCAAAALMLNITGCELAGEIAGAGEAAVTFRDGDGPFGPGKLNTNFMGVEGDVALNAIPLQDDPNAPLRLHAVWSNKCVGTSGQLLHGLFYTSDLNGELGITLAEGGKLNPAIFKSWSAPGVTCTVASEHWVGTVWGLVQDGTNHYMMILAGGLDDTDRPAYVWGRYVNGQTFNPSSYVPSCLEDLDPSGVAYKFHAYHFSDIDVDANTGHFAEKADTMYVACFSGMVGKAARWGYGTWDTGMQVHEIATRVGRADYCGTGHSYTQEGNPLQIEDVYGISGFDDESFPYEAAWSIEDGRATCLHVPRHVPLRPEAPGLVCLDAEGEPLFTLPDCDAQHLDDATFITRIAHE